MKFNLVLNPDTNSAESIPFSVSEADIDDAIDFGRVERGDSLEKQINDAACHKVMELRVTRRILHEPWALERDGSRVAASAGVDRYPKPEE
jgi:hypothetical protein